MQPQIVQYNFVHDTTIYNYSNWGYVAWNVSQSYTATAAMWSALLGNSAESRQTKPQVYMAAAISNMLPIPDTHLTPLTNSSGSWIGNWTGQHLRVSPRVR
jgi:hypothetical protein